MSQEYIYHYTSVESLYGMLLDPTAEEKRIIGQMSDCPRCLYFHAGDIKAMNDKSENMLLDELVKLISETTPPEIIGSSNINEMKFAVSFCTEQDYLPMWKIYATNGKGVCLRFKREGFEKSVFSVNTSRFITMKAGDCQYKTEAELKDYVNSIVKHFREITEPKSLILQIDSFCGTSSFFKLKPFEYEKEFRLAISSKFNQQITSGGQYGLIVYYPVAIPLNLVDEIMIGPSPNQDVIENGIRALLLSKGIDKLKRYGIDINIVRSSLLIR